MSWPRLGIWLSVIWGVVVWVAGEGLGAIFVGGGWLSGSPGSVIRYVARAMAGLWGLDALLQ